MASLTSGNALTCGKSDASKAASVVPLSPVSNADFGVIVASVFR
jgi:hypothetical protein